MIGCPHQRSWTGARKAGSLPKKWGVLFLGPAWNPVPLPPRCLWTFVRGWTATFVMQERKLRLEVVPDMPKSHNKWVMGPKRPSLPRPRQGG